MKTKKDRGIVRIDQPEKYNHGWWVRRRRGDKTHSKFFTDKRYGGKRKALLAARSFNDKLTETLPPINRTRIKTKATRALKALSAIKPTRVGSRTKAAKTAPRKRK